MIEANNSDCGILILGEDADIGDGGTVHIFGIRDAGADSSGAIIAGKRVAGCGRVAGTTRAKAGGVNSPGIRLAHLLTRSPFKWQPNSFNSAPMLGRASCVVLPFSPMQFA
jgi:hypothetical protein